MVMTDGQAKLRARVYQVVAAVSFTAGLLCLLTTMIVHGMGGPAWLVIWSRVFAYLLMGVGGVAYFVSGWIRGGGP